MNTGYHFTTWLSSYLVTCLHLGNKSERFLRHSVFFALIMSSFSSRHKLHRLDSGLYALTFFMMCKPVEKLRGHNHLVWLTNYQGQTVVSIFRYSRILPVYNWKSTRPCNRMGPTIPDTDIRIVKHARKSFLLAQIISRTTLYLLSYKAKLGTMLFICYVNDMDEFPPFHAWCQLLIQRMLYMIFCNILLVM
jgi:hypothetical protein